MPESSEIAKTLANVLEQGLGSVPGWRTGFPGRSLSSNLSSQFRGHRKEAQMEVWGAFLRSGSNISISFSMDLGTLGRSGMCGLEPGKQACPTPVQQPQTGRIAPRALLGRSWVTTGQVGDNLSRQIGRPRPGLHRWGGGELKSYLNNTGCPQSTEAGAKQSLEQ